tara:strand:- start:728 stop:1426 length:699 start_codon:yes stop_codon:yes gene_type:complete
MGGSTTKRSSDSGGGGGSSSNNNNNQSVNAAKDAAKKAKEREVAAGNKMYGGAVSKAVDDSLVKSKNVKVGSYFKKVGGDFIRLGNKEGERLYAAGDPSVSRSVIGNKESLAMKYGVSGGAMGSGDPTGAMTSTPISEEMLRRQNLIKGVATAGMSFAMPGVASTLLRAEAARSFTDYGQPGEAYEDYMEGFEAKQQGKKFKSKRSVQSFAGRVVDQIKTSILGGEGDKLGD